MVEIAIPFNRRSV